MSNSIKLYIIIAYIIIYFITDINVYTKTTPRVFFYIEIK